MSLFDRIAHLMKADVHGVVDALEDRRLVLRQALREAEVELDRKTARRSALGDEALKLDEERERLVAACETLDADVELALAEEKDELARFSARKLLERRGELARVAARSAEVERASADLDERLKRQEQELASLKARVRSALDGRERSEDPLRGAAVADAEVELELLRRRRGRQGGK